MLEIELGTGNPLADSLVSLAEVRAYASKRGFAVSAVDADLEIQVRRAHDYLLYVEPRLQGTRSAAVQALPFPREGVVLRGTVLSSTTIEASVKALVLALVESSLKRDLLPSSDGRIVKKEAVGPLVTEYAVDLQSSLPVDARVHAALAPFLRGGGALPALNVDRG